MQSKATSVQQYLDSLPADRRSAISAVRKVILANLDKDIDEVMQYGMIGYAVPHRVFPAGYHCDPKQPLCFAALGSQKNYMSLYMMSVYDCDTGTKNPAAEHSSWFREAWAKSGKKLDMGKCCVRFKRLDDLALDVIGESIRRVSAKKYIAWYGASRAAMQTKAKPAAKAKPATPRAKPKVASKAR